MSVVLTQAGQITWLDKQSVDAAQNITGATNASPAVITIAGHGFATGDLVAIYGVGGNTNVNVLGTVNVIDANTFTITGIIAAAVINGNAAYTSGGTAQRIRIGLTPADLGDMEATLDTMQYPQSSDVNRSNQETLRTILGL